MFVVALRQVLDEMNETRLMDVARSPPQGPASDGVQNTLRGHNSQVYIVWFWRLSLTEDNRAGRTMAQYDIFREQLAIKYPAFGHALWDPEPRNPDTPVQIGDVGFIRRGKFLRLFNAMLPADDPSHEFGVPEYHEPFSPKVLKPDERTRRPVNYCSAGVSVEAVPGYYFNRKVRFAV